MATFNWTACPLLDSTTGEGDGDNPVAFIISGGGIERQKQIFYCKQKQNVPFHYPCEIAGLFRTIVAGKCKKLENVKAPNPTITVKNGKIYNPHDIFYF